MEASLAKTTNNICLNYGGYDTIEELLNSAIKHEKVETNQISDGYHTFGELYEHRIANFIALCKVIVKHGDADCRETNVWRSLKHSDGELAFGGTWFVLGIFTEKGKQITYHLPISDYDKTDFAQDFETAPEWDGHTSADVLERLNNL